MEWFIIKTSTELLRVVTDEIVYVKAEGNYSKLFLTYGSERTMGFQLHYFVDAFHELQNNTFVRLGRSLIINKRYIRVINLSDQILILSGQQVSKPIILDKIPREVLKQLKELILKEEGIDNG